MTAIFVFQHNAGGFLNIRVISGLRKMSLRIALSCSPLSPMRSECAQAKPLLFLPTNQYLLQQTREGKEEQRMKQGTGTQKTKKKKTLFLMTILLPHPYSFRCCSLRTSEQQLLMSWFCCHKNFSKLNIAICYSVHLYNQSLFCKSEHGLARISNNFSGIQ